MSGQCTLTNLTDKFISEKRTIQFSLKSQFEKPRKAPGEQNLLITLS